MKIFVNDICYVNISDLVRKAIPSYIELDSRVYKGDEFVKLTGEQTIEYMKNRSDIIDYDDVKDLTYEELELKISEVYKKLEDYSNRWFNEKYYRRKGSEIDKKFLADYKLAEEIYNGLLKYQKNKKEIDNMICCIIYSNNSLSDIEQKENFIQDFLMKQRKREEQKQEMSSNVDYINWLNSFTLDKDGFSDDTWLYKSEELTDEDNKNVDKLSILYEIVNEYASLNNIKSLPCDFGNYYLVRLDDFVFELGILVGQGTIFYCKRVSIENESNFIDYKKIVNNKIKRLK